MKIYNCIGQNYERAGNVRYAVTYKPSGDSSEMTYSRERAMQIAKEWSDGMTAAKNGEEAYIGVKINSLTDKQIIDKLVEDSCAGGKIELVVRGICCLVAGVNGYTENVTVKSIVGRFLEHSRIYIFGTSQRQKIYISSADFMTRNTVKIASRTRFTI